MNPKCRCRRPAKAADSVTVPIGKINKLPGRVHRLGSGDNDRLGEEIKPGFPVPAQTNLIQQLVIILPVCFEIETQVEHRLSEHFLFAQ